MRTVALIGPDRLTGVPTDLAFDDLRNLGALPGHTSPAGAGFPIQVNSKSLVREVGGRIVNTNQPTFLFAAIPFSAEGGGAIDVFQLESGLDRLDVDTFTPGTQSLAVEGAALLGSYFRQ
jgi:hypothetical protein